MEQSDNGFRICKALQRDFKCQKLASLSTETLQALSLEYVRTNVRTYVRTYVHTYVRTYVRMYVHTYVRAYVPTYVRTYISRCDFRMLDANDPKFQSTLASLDKPALNAV